MPLCSVLHLKSLQFALGTIDFFKKMYFIGSLNVLHHAISHNNECYYKIIFEAYIIKDVFKIYHQLKRNEKGSRI